MKVCGAVWGVVLAVGVCAAQEGYTPLGEEPYEGELPHQGERWQGFSVEVPEGAEQLVIEVEGEGVALFVKEGEPIQSSWEEEATASSLEGGGRERVVLESSGEPVLRACTYFVDVVLLDPEVPAKFRIDVEVQQGGQSAPGDGRVLSRAEWERGDQLVVRMVQEGRLDEAVSLAEALVVLARDAFGSRHPDTLSSLNNLAFLYQAQGRYEEAGPLYRQCLDVRSEVLGERHPGTLVSLYNLARLYEVQGRYEEAERLLERCLEARREVLGERHLDTLLCLNRLAALYQGRGRHEEAEPLCRQCLEISREVLGERHPNTLRSLNNLASLYQAQGRFAEAEPLFQQCLELQREVLGERHPDTLVSLNNLAGVYESQGLYEQAEPLYRECLEISREVLGARHPDTLLSLNNLGSLYQAQGRYEEAGPLYRECVQIQRAVLGERHPSTLASLSNLGGLRQAQGRYEEAESLFEQCLEISREVLGGRHPTTLVSLNNLGFLYQAQGRFEEAEQLWERCLEVRRAVLGERHPSTLVSLNNLVGLYQGQGRYEEAEQLWERCLEVSREVLGERHPSTLISLDNLASLHSVQGRYEEAERLYQQCLEISREVLGTRHPETLTRVHDLACLYDVQGRYEEAERLYRQCLEIRLDALGARHPSTLTALNNMACVYQAQGRFEEAERLYRQCLEIGGEVLGERHPNTLLCLCNLAGLYQDQGRDEDAAPLWERLVVDSAVWLNDNLAGAHPDARSFWARGRFHVILGSLLSEAVTTPAPLDVSFRAAAYADGLVARVAQQTSRLARVARGDSRTRELARRLAQARRRLAESSLRDASVASGEGPGVALRRIERLQSLQAEVDELSQALGRATSAVRLDELRHVPSLDALTAPLSARSARVQLVRFAPWDPGRMDHEEERYAALVLGKDGSRAAVDLGLAEALEDEVGRYRAILLDPRTSAADLDLDEASRRLYQHLWAPLEEALEGVEEVYLIPDGELHLLAFDALLDDEYSYLGERLRITRAVPGEGERRDLERVAVVGNPAFGEGAYGDLPGAEREGEALAETLSGTKAKVEWLSGAAATRERVEEALAARPQIVHLATHGFFHPYEGPEVRWDSERVVIPEGIDPLVRCGLVFAGVNEGRAGSQWTASEVLGLDLEGVELVVLSACQTGVGEVVDGEGVNCLGSAFLYAGADHVLTTLWPVDDEQTRAFVQEFYERYLEGASAEEALRATKLAFLEDAEQPVRAHPRHWAGFVLLGR